MMSYNINKMKNFNIANTNIPDAFLHNEIEGTGRVSLYEFLAEMLLNIDPEKYGYKVIIERGKKVI